MSFIPSGVAPRPLLLVLALLASLGSLTGEEPLTLDTGLEGNAEAGSAYPRFTARFSGKAEAGWRTVSGGALNLDNALGLRRALYRQETKAEFDLAATETTSVVARLRGSATGLEYAQAKDSPQNYGTLALGFDQLFLRYDLSALQVTIGRAPFSYSTSTFMSPADYTRPRGAFFDEEGRWLASAALSAGPAKLTLTYLPAVDFSGGSPATEGSEVENFFAWTQSDNPTQQASLDLGFFLNPQQIDLPVELHLIGFLQEKSAYDPASGFYGSGGFTTSAILGTYFTAYGEALAGNGFRSTYRMDRGAASVPQLPGLRGDAPPYDLRLREESDFGWRGLVGLKYSPSGNATFDLQYYYNFLGFDGSALGRLRESLRSWRENRDAPNPYAAGLQRQWWGDALSKGLVFAPIDFASQLLILDLRLPNLVDRLDLGLTTALSVLDLSVFSRLTAEYGLGDQYALRYTQDLYLGPENTLFTLNSVPWSGTIALSFYL